MRKSLQLVLIFSGFFIMFVLVTDADRSLAQPKPGPKPKPKQVPLCYVEMSVNGWNCDPAPCKAKCAKEKKGGSGSCNKRKTLCDCYYYC
ncbi:hypothetical protein AALP_AAs52007U000400 [Arabis alpina]|uniref:Knottin scorpion toxin-like domain-containing protein n=1 Tax=Arabis alpina TaxID=50452 RepID=A0A087G2D1_ARAAL|nr:hypothetical protein AALP_AAs52007U000400 [Arabis alpina]